MIRAVTLDLDDTLWAIAPAIVRAEQRMDDWLRRHFPAVATRWSIPRLRELRDRVAAEHPELAHDFSAQRRLSLRHAFGDSLGADHHAIDDGVEAAFVEFQHGRHEIEPYPEVLDALARIAARVPLAALTNGNADLERLRMAQHFQFSLNAREFGRAKPDAAIFHAACERLGLAPSSVLHAGDDLDADVRGAHAAGLTSAWIDRHGKIEPPAEAHLHFGCLGALADWIEANTPEQTSSPADKARGRRDDADHLRHRQGVR